MAARSRSAGLALVIGTEYNDKDLRNLQRDLDKLKSKSRQAEGPFRKLGNSLRDNAGPALAAAGAAAGYMALQLGIDAVKAAAAEEKELRNLGITLDNLGVQFDMTEIDAFIQSMQFATGVSDGELRVAFTNLVRATKDVSDAQDLLKVALDVSAGSGKSLETITTALSKAQSGNFSALKRLIPTIDTTAIANKDLDGVVRSLSDQFGGSAAAAAGTYAGQLEVLGQIAGEVQEAFGAGFLDGFFKTSDAAQATGVEIQKLKDDVEALGTSVGQTAGYIAEAALIYNNTIGQVLALRDAALDASNGFNIFDGVIVTITEKLFPLLGVLRNVTDVVNLFSLTGSGATTAATALDRYSSSWLNAATTTRANPIVGGVVVVDPYGQALGASLAPFKDTIDQIVRDAQAAADAATGGGGGGGAADVADEVSKATGELARKVQARTNRILGNLESQLDRAKEAAREFRSIREGIVSEARADVAVTTFAPDGPITGRGIAANIRQRVALVKRFADAVKQLRGKLNGAALSDIIAQGPIAGLPYAQALLKDEKSLRQVNRLQGQLATPVGTIGRIGAELATGTTAARLAAEQRISTQYVIGKDAIQITVNGEITAKERRELRQAVRDALKDVGREGKNGKKGNVR